MTAQTFSQEFNERLDGIIARGKKAGLTLTDICSRSGVARATPDRWRASTPKTIELVDKMEAVVAAAEKQPAKN